MPMFVLSNSVTDQVIVAGDYGFVAPNASLVGSVDAVTMEGGTTLTNGGTIFSAGVGVRAEAGGTTATTILATGSVAAVREAFNLFDGDNRIYSAGTISGGQSAILANLTALWLNNTGQIFGNDATGVYIQNTATLVLANIGTIQGREYGVYGDPDAGLSRIQNDGVISGNLNALFLSDASDRVINRGSLVGDVDLNAGDDLFQGRGGLQSVLRGGAGFDTLIGGVQDETLDGGTDNDTILGDAGDDLIIGGDGNDRLRGGLGNDAMQGGLGQDSLFGDDGADLIDLGDGDDLSDGGFGNDTILGGIGRDTIRGGAEDDSLDGGADFDSLYGGAGDDVLDGGDLHDRLEGGVGDDSLIGNLGNDTLLGQAGGDTLSGGGGIDQLDGGLGDDLLTGGAAADTFLFQRAPGNDRITDFADNVDKLDLRAMDFASVAVVIAASSDSSLGLLIDFKLVGGGTLVLTGMVLANLDATDLLI